jgi:hypothetical protein
LIWFCSTEKSLVPSAADDRRAGTDQKRGVGDQLEAFSPIVASPGEHAHGFVSDMKLDTIAIELDFVDPAGAGWHLVDRLRQRWFDEAGRPL